MAEASARDHGKGTDGRRSARCHLPASLCAYIFSERERSGYEAGVVIREMKHCVYTNDRDGPRGQISPPFFTFVIQNVEGLVFTCSFASSLLVL